MWLLEGGRGLGAWGSLAAIYYRGISGHPSLAGGANLWRAEPLQHGLERRELMLQIGKRARTLASRKRLQQLRSPGRLVSDGANYAPDPLAIKFKVVAARSELVEDVV